jgi:RNA polymerase II subunit A small phosphatase-like protein
MLVVLDLNGTILDSTHHLRKGVQPHAKARKKFVYFRPYMSEFLSFLFTCPDIEVGIWTSNIAENAHAVVETAFTEEQRSKLAFIMSREDCALGPNYTSFKSLAKIEQRGYSLDEVLIVDDSEAKIIPSNFAGWIRIEEFEASVESLVNDRALITLRKTIEARFQVQKVNSTL